MKETASQKLYFKIGEIAQALKINTSVLRFWETQFSSLAPSKTRTGQRIYSQRDYEQIKEIHNLLYVQKLTIAGAKTRLSLGKSKRCDGTDSVELIQTVCHELKEIRKMLQ